MVEVADSSLERDRTLKRRLYARAGIPHYWIVNLPDCRVEAFTRPCPGDGAAYEEARVFRPGEAIPLILEGVLVADLPVADLLAT